MGRVYLGRTPAGSAVAVKVVHRAYASDASFRQRFAQEVAAARRVQGLYTVPVVDADLRADEPWLATAYVPGPSLQHAVAERGPLPADAALALIAKVAEALQSIHAADVIHRDLKPSNIILTAEGPKVIDFGIARAADVTAVTATGMRTGTPAYMAPEYIRGQSVTEAGDVFALGVVAHFAATGRLAFGGGNDHGVTYRILEQAPDLDGCPEPLRAIAAGCLEKAPERRPTPAEVVELCRGIAEPAVTDADTLTAVPPPGRPGPATPGPPVAPGSPMAPGSPGAPGSPDAATRAAPPPPGSPAAGTPAAPTPAAHAPTQVAAPDDPAHPPGSDSLPHPQSPEPRTDPTPRLPVLIGGFGVGVIVLAIILIAVFVPPSTPDRRERPLPYPAFQPTAALTSPSPEAEGIAFSPDGRTLATGSLNGKLRLWDLAGRKPRVTLTQRDEVGNVFKIRSVAFSPNGKLLATGLDGGPVGVWDVARRRQIRFLHFGGESVAFSPDGKLLAFGGQGGAVYLWDTDNRTDKPAAYYDHKTNVTSVAFSPDGRTLASAGDDSGSNLTPHHSALLWNVADRDPDPYGQDGPRATLSHTQGVTSVAFSPDGKTLATGSLDDKIRLWDVADGRQKATLSDSNVTSVEDLEFSPDGKTLATTAYRGVLLWDVARRTPRAILSTPADEDEAAIADVAFSPDGRLVAGSDRVNRTVQLWKTPS
ncbi:WD40 repeat domain-containing serine/threonine protein kinase [Streptomyces sp. CA-251387]|uniref:WD40 repeat domain-containing serine/threonine protein kinase n=1 Tax=Streptomyces sp. CA-251387 TaxID=3240064 RepID=UPI003D90E2C6